MIFKTDLAKTVWQTKYRYAYESQLQTFRRLAKALASVEKTPEEWENKFFETLVSFDDNKEPVGLKCTMGGRITANLGTKYKNATLLNCYISGEVSNANVKYEREIPSGEKIKIGYKTDIIGDDMKNIMLTLMEQTLTLGQEGGWGSNFSWIRPRGSLVKGVGVEHPGVVKFLEMFDKTSEVIVAGNSEGYKDPLKDYFKKIDTLDTVEKKRQSRKGAMMAVLNIDHPDIQEFIIAKEKGGRLTKFNLSVMITDEFLKAVEDDSIFELKFNGMVYKRIMARDLYDLIMKSTYNRAEPGILFHGNMQKNNPLAYMGEVTAVNPCVIGDTLVLTSIGWVRFYKLFEMYKSGELLPHIVTRDEFGTLYNSELKNVLLTQKNSELYKISFDNSEFLITNGKHKFYDINFCKVQVSELVEDFFNKEIISGNGFVKITNIERLDYKEDVFDLTAVPNYNFFSLLNKEEYIDKEKVILNDTIELDKFYIVDTESGQKFSLDLIEGEEVTQTVDEEEAFFRVSVQSVKNNHVQISHNSLFQESILNVDCGEIPGNTKTTTVCLLGSVNLTQYVKMDRTFDLPRFKDDISTFTRMLDNINDLHNKDLPAYLWATKNIRQFGMGLNGFGSTLYMMGIAYNSKEAIELAEKLNQTKLDIALYTSAMLAREKGAAPAFSEEYFNTEYWKVFLKGKISAKTKAAIEKYGLRNLKVTTNPPLGNSSVLCDSVSNGLEPVFMHSYNRTYIVESWPKNVGEKEIKSLLDKKSVGGTEVWDGVINGERYYYEPHNRGLCKIETVYDYGYLWVKENYPGDLEKDYLITTNDLSVTAHLNIQESFQKYIDQAVSKTINIPKDYPFEDFKQVYLDAHRRGLLGLTTYREGTMEAVLSKVDEKKKTKNRDVIKNVKLPNKFINGPCEVIFREKQKFYIHFSYMIEDDQKSFPIALWINSNQKPQGEAKYVNRALKSLAILLTDFGVPIEEVNKLEEKYKEDYPYNKIAKAVSMCLRHNLPIKNIVNSLENLEDDNVSTLLTAVRKFLSQHIEDGEAVINGECNICGSSNIVYEGGCSVCKDCGNSNCG